MELQLHVNMCVPKNVYKFLCTYNSFVIEVSVGVLEDILNKW